jgi:hypothetical protein
MMVQRLTQRTELNFIWNLTISDRRECTIRMAMRMKKCLTPSRR